MAPGKKKVATRKPTAAAKKRRKKKAASTTASRAAGGRKTRKTSRTADKKTAKKTAKKTTSKTAKKSAKKTAKKVAKKTTKKTAKKTAKTSSRNTTKKVAKKSAKKAAKKTTKKTTSNSKGGRSKTAKRSVKKSAKTATKKAATRKAPVVRSKKTARSKKTSPATIPDAAYSVMTVATASGDSLVLDCGKPMQEFAMRWRYAIARRLRWRDRPKHVTRQAVFDDILAKLNVDKSTLQGVLGDAGVIEVQIPYIDESTGWAARIAPWEFLLSSAAKAAGNSNSLCIVRCLKTDRLAPSYVGQPRVLFVRCTPGVLNGSYEFETERASLAHVFGKDQVRHVVNPSIDDLRDAVQAYQPHVVHLAGIDNNQAREILRDRDLLPEHWPSTSDWDGMVFASSEARDEATGLVPIGAEELAVVLNSGAEPLSLVTANVYHSASRICAMAVAEGAELALGFQDTVHDTLAEIVVRDFYNSWRDDGQPLAAFVRALDVARTAVSLSGTGIVLWSAHSLLQDAQHSVDSVLLKRRNSQQQKLELGGVVPEWFSVDVRVRERLNYSLLHNDSGGLFEALEFRKEEEGILYDVGIEVVLYLGSESHPYYANINLREYLTKVDHKIKIPLTSSLIRTVSEPLRTSLRVTITVGKQCVYQDSHRVTLLPADEWTDTDSDRIWLPSFVLPRDRAVERIIDRAQNHLATLADDRSRGFDGYQSIDEHDPQTFSEIDVQAQAIWAAVVSDFGIRYINPPPSYTKRGQRLRTPTQIVRGGRGTCIDLALLLCACLEYIDVYPVIFLLEGHAFAGYWRSELRYEDFLMGQQGGLEKATMMKTIGSMTDRQPWILPSDSYAEILNEVNSGFLYPIETVGFTTHGSFWQAIEEGVDNLRSRSEFHSLIDVLRARRAFITPLPIIDAHGTLDEDAEHD